MLFVVDKIRFQKFISIVREDRKKNRQGKNSPYLRIKAEKDQVEISSSDSSATIKTTVYEPGVLFIRTTLFRRVLKATHIEEKFITFQVDDDALLFGDVRMPFETNDMILYCNPMEAPSSWPPPPKHEDLPKVGKSKALYRHKTNGQIFAIETDDYGIVVSTAGPLLFKDIDPETLKLDGKCNDNVKYNFKDFELIPKHEYLEMLRQNGFSSQITQNYLFD